VCLQKGTVDTVERIQFTTQDEYTMLAGTTKIAKFHLIDPDPPMPAPFAKRWRTKQSEYVLVEASSMKNLGKSSRPYMFQPSDAEIMREDWEPFEEDMSVDDLCAGDNFLLFYQRIDASGKVCKVKPTARAAPVPKQRPKGKGGKAEVPSPPPPKRRKIPKVKK
jgi:hypothetical protein